MLEFYMKIENSKRMKFTKALAVVTVVYNGDIFELAAVLYNSKIYFGIDVFPTNHASTYWTNAHSHFHELM